MINLVEKLLNLYHNDNRDYKICSKYLYSCCLLCYNLNVNSFNLLITKNFYLWRKGDFMEKAFAKNLRTLRKERKLSQQKLASQVGVTQQCVSEWEKGKIEPTMSPLWRLADVFDISIDELIGRKELI